ncbi:MAG: hypothetical protein B7Z26_11950 [Asticcacaulis sp. 32-58-5]|nr:MAG: hypothetical protein B7Z26_11950 [Asticcacaulis sp. 32-58-5]
MAHFLIIAGSSDIGQATKALLIAQGHTVTTTARDGASGDIALDATDFAAVEQAFSKAMETHGPIDGVVNCAGSLWLKPAHLTSAEQFRAVIDASLTTAFAVVRAAGKHMTAGGSVVLISSAAGMTKALTANDMSRKVSESMHALGRLGTADDIARAIAFLLDPSNNWITGQVLGVDGGLGGIRPRMKI